MSFSITSFGQVTLDKVKEILLNERKDQSFIIRESNTRNNSFILSYVNDQAIHHISVPSDTIKEYSEDGAN